MNGIPKIRWDVPPIPFTATPHTLFAVISIRSRTFYSGEKEREGEREI